jgi:predicted transcriptional regulator of viral defense system
MNWTTILAEESRRNSVLRLDDLAHRYNVNEPIARNALRRYESRGLVEHISNKVYINRLNQNFSPRELVNILRPESYVSLESALVEQGVISQSPAILTCVTTGYPKTFRSLSVTVSYRKLSKTLYWGFEERRTRYNNYKIALPEKALLDWIYLSRQEGLPTPLDEINLKFLNHRKLTEFAERFPRTVQEVVKRVILDHAIAASERAKSHAEGAKTLPPTRNELA